VGNNINNGSYIDESSPDLDDQGHSANTNDLRGKILRIKPKADGGYDIPEGNLFPQGSAQTRPEIYVMGTRNAYTLDYDNRTRRLLWGCVGPDNTGANTEEHNMTAVPGFFGWPYFAGQNHVIVPGKDPAKPVNNASVNTGLQNLPPAKGSINYYPQSAAITGPVYRYTNVTSTVKLPPHFDGVWFATDFNKGSIDTIGVNAAGTARTGYARILSALKLDRPTDFKQGPDGALYAINYSGYFSTVPTTAIVRLEYTGSCRPVTSGVLDPKPIGEAFAVRGWTLAARETGSGIRVADLTGRTLYSSREPGRIHDLAPALHGRAGLYIVTVDAPSGARTRKLALPAP
jgi:cytochrome c